MTASRLLPTGTVTFMFTDIEGSTRLLRDLGDRYGEVLADHNRMLREAFSAHGGIEVSTEGDAFFVVFTRPLDAVSAAARAQRSLSERSEATGIDVRVRIGIHTGEGRLLGDNYGGLDVHRAARIASSAHGGQVLLSDATRALVEPSLGPDVRIKDLGEHELKDLEHPERLLQLCAEGLRFDFPEPRSLLARPNNLPQMTTPFVARDHELKEILALLDANRLVTLTGPGGTGKTRLAMATAAEALLDFDDGAFAVFLSPVSDPGLVASTIATALGVREQGTTPIADSVTDYLSDKHMLLVLDNFEQVVSAAPFVASLLASASRLTVLVTSRAALRISGEQQYPVPPMTLPDLKRLPPLEALSGYEAVSLFVQRARAVKPDFRLTEENAHAIAEICWRLDGLPLAIELAAARVRLLGVGDILTRLDKRLSLLTGGARDLPARQQTLRDAIAWSYNLLDEPLRAFFMRLAVFVGGWTLQAADEICNPDGELGVDTLDALGALTEGSLVRQVETESDQTRFRMLQTIREYGLELLESSPGADEVKDRHARFFLDLAEEVSPRLTTADAEAARALEMDHDNLRAVLRWALVRQEVEVALRLGTSLWRFWQLNSHLAEGRRWLSDILALPAAEQRTKLRAGALMALGSITYWQNDFEPTRAGYLEALEISRAIGDRPGTAEALYNTGFLSLLDRDPAGARPFYEESRALARELGDDHAAARAIWGLSMCALQERNLEAARALADEGLALFEALDDWFGISTVRFVYFQIARLTGNVDEAYRITRLTLEDVRLSDDFAAYSAVIEMLMAIESMRGRHESALRMGGAAEAMRTLYGGGSPPPLLDFANPRPAAAKALGPERSAELWDEGRAMSVGEALAAARKILDET